MQHKYVSSALLAEYRIGTPTPSMVIAFFGLLTVWYGVVSIPVFNSPLADIVAGDIDQWEYMGYYVANHLRFDPLPHIDWVNNQTLYPYGTNHVFQGWAFESNVLYALCYRLFGAWGPWMNLYYLLSLFIGSAGVFVLLRYDYGIWRSASVALLVSFFNFYALNKFPGHFAYAIIHWTVLIMLSDFMLARRIVTNQPVSLRFILLKGLLLALCLGQDVGYVLGFALSSFTLTNFFVAGWLGWLAYRCPALFQRLYRRTWLRWQLEWTQQPLLLSGMILAIIVVGLFYVPLLLDLLRQTSSFVFADRFAGGHGWVHPLRILLPYMHVPYINALDNPFTEVLHDMPEGHGAGSAGWLLLLLGGIGFLRTPSRLRWAFVPLLLFGILHALYHPIRLPLLQVFPWCQFNRIPARATLVYPVILAAFTLHWRPRVQPLLWLFLLFIGLSETVTMFYYRHDRPVYQFPASFRPYMERVKQQPGEAVLDWPFCVIGGNGVGIREGLCPLYEHTSTLYALQRFHHKKTVGQYYGRMHSSQLQPFIKAGWAALLNHPDSSNVLKSHAITTCLTPEQWRFFDQFYRYNDFAGVNLYIDLLPDSCVQSFYTHFGLPVAQTTVSGVGRVVFIPKPSAGRHRVNLQSGLAVRFPCGCTTNQHL